jgi:hypothetical protein
VQDEVKRAAVMVVGCTESVCTTEAMELAGSARRCVGLGYLAVVAVECKEDVTPQKSPLAVKCAAQNL